MSKIYFTSNGINSVVGETCGSRGPHRMEDMNAFYEQGDTKLYSLYDGHGGKSVVKYTKDEYIHTLIQEPSYRQYEETPKDTPESIELISNAIQESFKTFDEILYNNQCDDSGTTVNLIAVNKNYIICGNVGDTVALVIMNGEYKLLSREHNTKLFNSSESLTPEQQEWITSETTRITNAGGFISVKSVYCRGGDVCGLLNVTRALGDFEGKVKYGKTQGDVYDKTKDYPISTQADVIIHNRSDNDKWLVQFTDGVTDGISIEKLVDLINQNSNKSLEEIITICINEAFLESNDNISLRLINLCESFRSDSNNVLTESAVTESVVTKDEKTKDEKTKDEKTKVESDTIVPTIFQLPTTNSEP